MTTKQTRLQQRALLAKANQTATQLDPAELASLKELNKGLLAPTIPDNHAAKLISVGLAEQKLGGIAPTALGRLVSL